MRIVSLLVLLVVAIASPACSGDPAREADKAAAAAAREAELAAEAEARTARLETQRLAALWTYNETTMAGARQFSAAIRSANSVDTDGLAERAVLLVFRDHATWGRSSYLVLQAGDFECAPRCSVTVVADDDAPRRMAARRPTSDDAIALFINDWQALWRLTGEATRISIEFPVRAGGTRTATFDVAGLDESKMSGW